MAGEGQKVGGLTTSRPPDQYSTTTKRGKQSKIIHQPHKEKTRPREKKHEIAEQSPTSASHPREKQSHSKAEAIVEKAREITVKKTKPKEPASTN